MSSKITFYYNPMSRAAMVHWMLEEVGEPYETKLLRFGKGEHKTPEFLQINPMGKLPTIVHKDTVVTETPAICAYLADQFSERQLAPATDDPARGTYYRWLFFGHGCFEPAVIDKVFKRPPVEKKGTLGWGSYEDTLQVLEKGLAIGPWLLGDRFTAADVYIGSQLDWAYMMKTVPENDVFRKYLERCQERDAYKRYATARQAIIADMGGDF